MKLLPNIVQFEANAPDKYCYGQVTNANLIQKDRRDMKDYPIIYNDGSTMYLPVNDRDILYAKQYPLYIQRSIILPQCADGVIDFYKFVPKNSEFYQTLEAETGLKYRILNTYTADQFGSLYDRYKDNPKFVLKTTLGWGSYGVIVMNQDRVPQAGAREQYQQLNKSTVDKIVSVAEHLGCEIIEQEFAYNEVTNIKYNLNIIFRGSELVAYKFDIPENDSTNFNHAVFVRSEFTDELASKVVKYLVSKGCTDGIIGVEGYTDMKSEASVCEFNFRCDNSMFTFEVFGLDFIRMYVYPDEENWMDKIPYGNTPYIRYWRACKYEL